MFLGCSHGLLHLLRSADLYVCVRMRVHENGHAFAGMGVGVRICMCVYVCVKNRGV